MTSYNNPPFVEAVCEIRFTSNNEEWDVMYPSQYYEAIKDKFPNKKTEKSEQIRIEVTPNGIQQASVPQYVLKGENHEQNLSVRFSNDLLLLNTVKPYMLWDKFKEHILFCFEAYKNLIHPQTFQRLSLRYINKLNAGEQHSYQAMKEIFILRPHIPEDVTILPNSIQMALEIPFENQRDFLAIQQATLLPEPNMSAPMLFDIAYTTVDATLISFNNFSEWLDNAHGKIESIFENSLTDKVKSTFNN